MLKITSVNSPIIIIRLVISLFIKRVISQNFGEIGIDIMGQVRSIMQGVTSLTSLGVFNGMVKYVAEHKGDRKKLNDLFSTAFVFWIIGSLLIGVLLVVFSDLLSEKYLGSKDYATVFIAVGIISPAIGLQRIYNGIINGLTEYKKFAKVDLSSYIISSILLFYFTWNCQFTFALYAIVITPAIQLSILLFVFIKTFKNYIDYKQISFRIPFAKVLLAFTLISFFSTVIAKLIVETEIRNMIRNNISQIDSGIWSGMLELSQNYMVFSSLLFTMYVIPRFANIKTKPLFFKEVGHIYKTLLPLFALGMIVIYFSRYLIIDIVYPTPGFKEMAPLFKWQLIGDFIRLGAMILGTQFLAKKMVRTFIFSELLSLAIFFGLTYFLIPIYGVEGVVMAHFFRYVVYFFVVLFLVWRYFKKNNEEDLTVSKA